MALPKKVWEKGYVQVYTGNGKGKTTAGFGLALRAVGAGFKVYIGQFVKGMDYIELKSFEALKEQVTLRQLGTDHWVFGNPSADDLANAAAGLEEARREMLSGKYKLVVLDEANVAVSLGLLKVEQMLELIDVKPEGVELVLTGRNAPEEIIERADLVTEMREIKHYYQKGVKARLGIEC
ncbi:MAG: cob(I)yrinic acid a,c-diamide adenosyltransferase [bacterium]|nr:cob(I)yrinic acid a,c-diamide adenosyltransferase [bacterium]